MSGGYQCKQENVIRNHPCSRKRTDKCTCNASHSLIHRRVLFLQRKNDTNDTTGAFLAGPWRVGRGHLDTHHLPPAKKGTHSPPLHHRLPTGSYAFESDFFPTRYYSAVVSIRTTARRTQSFQRQKPDTCFKISSTCKKNQVVCLNGPSDV